MNDRKLLPIVIIFFSVCAGIWGNRIFTQQTCTNHTHTHTHLTDLVAISCKRILKKVVPNSRFGAVNRYNTHRACNVAYTVRQGHRGLLRHRRWGAFHQTWSRTVNLMALKFTSHGNVCECDLCGSQFPSFRSRKNIEENNKEKEPYFGFNGTSQR